MLCRPFHQIFNRSVCIYLAIVSTMIIAKVNLPFSSQLVYQLYSLIIHIIISYLSSALLELENMYVNVLFLIRHLQLQLKYYQAFYVLIWCFYMIGTQNIRNDQEQKLLEQPAQNRPQQNRPQHNLQNLDQSAFNQLSPKYSSVYLKQYIKIMGDFDLDIRKKLNNFKGNNQNQLSYEQNVREKELHIKLKSHSCNYEILKYEIKWQGFKGVVCVLNDKNISKCHKFQELSKGQCTIVYDLKKYNCVIKCFHYQSSLTPTFLASVLSEYFLTVVAAAIGVGPQIPRQVLGFDLVIFHDCIQFVIQRCYPFSQLKSGDQRGLKNKLNILHAIGMVHRDIKPINILYSPSKNSLVFIDYGFSEMIDEQIGQKTLTVFNGSPDYCSSQVKDLMRSSSDYVDLYYNDAHCLKQTFKEFSQQLKIVEDQQQKQLKNIEEQQYKTYQDQKQQEQHSAKHGNQIKKILIKYQLYSGKIFQKNTFQMKLMLLCFDQFSSFFFMLPYSLNRDKNFNMLIRQSVLGTREIQSITNYRQKKENIFKKKESTQAQNQHQQSEFKKRIQKIPQKIISKIDSATSLKVVLEFSLKKSVTQLAIIQQNNKYAYLQRLASCLNMLQCNASWHKKMQAITTWQHLELISFKAGTNQLKKYTFCLKKILEDYLQNGFRFNIKIIWVLLYNLIILDAYNIQQIVAYIKRITKLPLKKLEVARILFNLYHVIIILEQKIKTEFRHREKFIYINVIISLMHNLQEIQQPLKQHVITALYFYLKFCNQNLIDQNIYFQFKQIFNYLIDHNQLSKQFKREINQSFFAKTIKINNSNFFCSGNLQNNQKNIWNFVSFEPDSVIIKNEFTFYHFALFSYINEINLNQKTLEIYSIYERCLQHPHLINNFYMYLLHKKILFIDKKVNKQYIQQLIDKIDIESCIQSVQLANIINFYLFQIYNPQSACLKQENYCLLRQKLPLPQINDFQARIQKQKQKYEGISYQCYLPQNIQHKNQWQQSKKIIEIQNIFLFYNKCVYLLLLYTKIYSGKHGLNKIIMYGIWLFTHLQNFNNFFIQKQGQNQNIKLHLLCVKIHIYKLMQKNTELEKQIMNSLSNKDNIQNPFFASQMLIIQLQKHRNRYSLHKITQTIKKQEIFYQILFNQNKLGHLASQLSLPRLRNFFHFFLYLKRDFKLFQKYNNQILKYFSQNFDIKIFQFYLYMVQLSIIQYPIIAVPFFQYIKQSNFYQIPQGLQYRILLYSQLLFCDDNLNQKTKKIVLTILDFLNLLEAFPRRLCLQKIYIFFQKIVITIQNKTKDKEYFERMNNCFSQQEMQAAFNSLNRTRRYHVFLSKKLVKIYTKSIFPFQIFKKQYLKRAKYQNIFRVTLENKLQSVHRNLFRPLNRLASIDKAKKNNQVSSISYLLDD